MSVFSPKIVRCNDKLTIWCSKNIQIIETDIFEDEFLLDVDTTIIEFGIDSLSAVKKFRKQKVISLFLAIMLGPFGMHRIFLGCSHHIPILYTLTLGGGLGLLPLIDIVTILITKENKKEQIINNNNLFLWVN